MSEDIRKMIDKVMNFKQFVNESFGLSNERPIKTQQYSQEGRSTMGNRGVPYIAGIKNTYEKGKFTIDEYIPRDDVKHDKTKIYIVKGFDDDSTMRIDNVFNWNEVEKKDKVIHEEELTLIKSTDLTKAIEFMEKNKEGFIYFMKHLQENDKLSKPMAFMNTIKDYYKEYSIFTTSVIAKIMIKYGYEFISLKEIRKLMK